MFSPLIEDAEPFDSVESALVWAFMKRNESSGAFGRQYVAAEGGIPRPCEPADVLIVVDMVTKKYALDRGEVDLIRSCGWGNLRQTRQDARWPRIEALLRFYMERKGIVHRPGGHIQEPAS